MKRYFLGFPWMRSVVFCAAMSALLTPTCGALGASGPGRWVIQPPASGVYVGAYAGPRSNERTCEGVGQAVGKTMQICLAYLAIPTLPRILTDPRILAMASAGTIPFASLGCKGGATYTQIAAGAQDTALQRDATALKSYAARFPKNPLLMIRPFHEFNLNMGNPRGNPNGNNCFSAQSVPGMQSEFIAAYRHVVTFLAAQGVTNVTWVWCPAIGPGVWNRFGGDERLRGFYPGDSYVDWTCADAYDKSENGGGLHNAFGNIGFFAQFHKPLIIGETGECNSDSRSQKCSAYDHTQEQYIGELTTALQPGGWLTGAGVKALVYFDQSVQRSGYNWSFDAAGLRAFRQLVDTPYFYPPIPPARWVALGS